MHIVSRRNMLALPVERLVGSSNHSHGHRTRPPMVMSPDSSASDSSNSDSPNTPNAKVFSSYASQLLTNNALSNNGSSPSQNNGRRSHSPVQTQIQTSPTSTMSVSSNSMNTLNIPNTTNNNCIISSTSDELEVKIKTSCSPTPSPSGYSDEGGNVSSDDGGHENSLLSPSGTEESVGDYKKSGLTMLSSGKDRSSRNQCKGDGMEIQLTVQTKKEEEGGSRNGGAGGSKKRRNSSDDNREGNKIYRNNRDGDSGTGTSAVSVDETVESPLSSQQKMTIRLIENDHIDVDDMVDVDVDVDIEPKPTSRCPSRNNSISKMDNDNVLDDSSDENNSICGRPPSRPPSSTSSTVTSASATNCTFPLSPSSESPSPIKGSIAMITRPHRQHHHHHHHTNAHTFSHASHINSISNSLKFSIDDILRPEFGKIAIQRISRRLSNSSPHSPHLHQNHRRSSVNNLNGRANSFSGEFPESQYNSSSSNHHLNVPQPQHQIQNQHQHQHQHHAYTKNKDANHGSNLSPRSHTSSNSNSIDSNSVGSQSHSQRLGRPSSVKDHSEDSNSSCTSRKEEVVDETKVNPKVPQGPLLWPAWVYCTRYSDRPSSGPRSRRVRKPETPGTSKVRETPEEKRPRTAFTAEQLARLKQEFDENRYLTERRRQDLARDLKLHENQIKIWFQNKRAKLKKSTGTRGSLAIQLMNQGLYNHSTVPIDEDDEMYEAMMQQQ